MNTVDAQISAAHTQADFQGRALLCQLAVAERQCMQASFGNGWRAHIDRGIRPPDQLHDAHCMVAAPTASTVGRNIQTVGQQHVQDQQKVCRKTWSGSVIVVWCVAPPQQGRHTSQHNTAAYGKMNPSLKGPVIKRGVDDIFGIFDVRSTREPDQIHHPVQLEPQCGRRRLHNCLGFMVFLLYFQCERYDYTTSRHLAQTFPVR